MDGWAAGDGRSIGCGGWGGRRGGRRGGRKTGGETGMERAEAVRIARKVKRSRSFGWWDRKWRMAAGMPWDWG